MKVTQSETDMHGTQRERERVGRGTCDKFKSRLAPKNFENINVRLLMMIVGTRVF